MSFMTPVAQRRYVPFAIIPLMVIALLLLGQSAITDIERAFGGKPGCFVLRQLQGSQTIYNPAQAKKRLPPYSTFKIPNSLVALETGIVRSPTDQFRWKGEKFKYRPEIEHDYLFRDVFQESVLWVYQRIARQVGRDRYRPWLQRFHYGNQDISGSIDTFWLGSTLKISALEQVDFLSKLATNQLGLSPRTLPTFEQIALADQGKGWQLYAKTGTARSGLAWYVGWVRRGTKIWVFAMNLEGKHAKRDEALRISRQVLKSRKLIG